MSSTVGFNPVIQQPSVELTPEQIQARISFYTQQPNATGYQIDDGYDAGSSSYIPALVSIPVGDGDKDQYSVMQSAFNNATPAQQQELVTQSSKLSDQLLNHATSSNGDVSPDLQQSISDSMNLWGSIQNPEGDNTNLVTGAMFMALDESYQDLTTLAGELNKVNQQKSVMQEDITELEDIIQDTDWDAGETATFTYSVFDEHGNKTEKTATFNSKEEATEKLNSLKDQRDVLNGTSQEWQLKLQMATNKYNQIMTTLTNILKSYNDTAKAIIANFK